MNIERTQRMSKWIATVEEARAMMQRRGYHVGDYMLEDENTFVGSIAYGAQRYSEFVEGLGLVSVNYTTKLEIEQMLDGIRGQHHMQCECGEPVLVKYDVEVKDVIPYWRFPEPATPEPTPHVRLVCRAVAASPDSEPIEKCPGCGLPLGESVREIDDFEKVK